MRHDLTDILTNIPAGVSYRATADGFFLELPAANARVAIGVPACRRFAGAYRYEPFWMRPMVARTVAEIPPETQFLLGERSDGRVVLFVPLVSVGAMRGGTRGAGGGRCSLSGGVDNQLVVVVEAGSAAAPAEAAREFPALFVAVQPAGETLDAFLARAAAAVAGRLGIKLRKDKSLAPFVDCFGWCTWDSFYKEVSHDKVREGLESFKKAGVPPRLLILDDGWQTERTVSEARGARLTSLAPNAKFGHDLSPTTRMAKDEFGVRHVLAWHALQGYWSGLDAEALPQYQVWETPRHFSPGILHHFPQANTQYWGSAASVISPEHIGQFFDDYHALLQSQGVDGVKVDNQAAMEGLTRDVPRVALYQAYRRALEESVAVHFAGNILHCMSCANDLLYAAGSTPLTRTSTDFWPKKPETHGLHLWTNALVSLWFRHFIHPDWDMFQSHLEGGWSEFHAAGRAICGGPIYVSDQPGRHDVALLRRLVLSDGTLPRCDRPATIARDCLFRDVTREPLLLKILNTNRQTTAGVIGLFNCHYDPDHPASAITGTFTPADIPEIQGYDRYVVHLARGHGTGEPLPFVAASADRIKVSLAQAQYEIATIVPLEDGLAIVGLLDKLNPAATVKQITRNTNSLHLTLRDAGTLGLWSDQPLKRIEQNGIAVPFQSTGNWITVTIPALGEVTLTL